MITEGRNSYEITHQDMELMLQIVTKVGEASSKYSDAVRMIEDALIEAEEARTLWTESFSQFGPLWTRILANSIDNSDDNGDDGSGNNPDDPINPPSADYPTPHLKNPIRPEDIDWDGGTWSFKPTDTLGYMIRSRGGETPDGDYHITFIGWDFSGEGRDKAWSALNLPDGSHVDFIDCKFSDARQALAVESNADDDRSFHVRLFDCAFEDNYRNPRSGHSTAVFISPAKNSRGCTFGVYNTSFINSGTGPTDGIRDNVATIFDHAVYLNRNGLRAEFVGCAFINYASQAVKGPWQEMHIENCVMINGAFGGFFGADSGEQSDTGERRTEGVLKDVLIYGQTDLMKTNSAHSFGYWLQSCDALLENLTIANPNPRVNNYNTPPCFILVSQGDRPINVDGTGNHVYGYENRFRDSGREGGATKTGREVTNWQADVTWHDERLPDLDSNQLINLLVSENLRPDEAYSWSMSRLISEP